MMQDSIIDVAEDAQETESTVDSGNQIVKILSRTPVTFSRLYRNKFQKPKTLTLEVRQTVHTVATYPTQRVDSDLQDNLFDTDKFQFDAKTFPSKENRVAWTLVPETTTQEEALASIAKFPEAVIYRILSNYPIL